MYHARRYVTSLFLAAALATPAAIMAMPKPQNASVQVRVYDRDHKDYHNWDDHENQEWGIYLNANHKKPHEFTTANKREQANYWNWRHSHPD